jgi:hypothetical protein
LLHYIKKSKPLLAQIGGYYDKGLALRWLAYIMWWLTRFVARVVSKLRGDTLPK